MSSSNCQVSIPMLQINSNGPVEMTPRDQNPPTERAVLSFHNIFYRVQMKSGSLCHRNTFEREILSNINGIMKPGLNAIMGPTGGGKSSLLDVLAARKDPHGLSGDVLINGAPQPANFKSNSGYVVQDDVVMGTLTVRENLQFSAALRLPTTMTNHEKNERINNIIKELGLNKVADSKVQSRGDRKKTSIAVELITEPSILFLDEPTTHLDLSTANDVLSLLEGLSKQGRTIIFSVHRPQYSIFKMFSSLTLLASGRLLFHGPAQEAVEYFKSAGYHCEPYNNPADFFLDVINGDYSAVALNREEEGHEANEAQELVQRERQVQLTPEFYANSSFYRDTKAELDQLSSGQRRSSACEEITCVTSFCHQLRWITWRSFKNLCGFPLVAGFQIIIIFIVAVGIGATFLGLKNACTNIQYRAWAFYVLTVFQCVTSMSAREIFLAEKKLFLHENFSGYYRVSSYFFGKLLSDLLPRRLLLRIIFTCILYFMIGLKPGAGAFFTMMFTILMVAYSTTSMVLAVGIAQNAASMETLLVTIYFAFMMVFLGMSLNFGNMTPQLSWLQYLSIPHYGYMALQHNEFLGQNFCPGPNATESSGCSSHVICSGEEFLTIQGIDLSPWGLWQNLLALAGVTAVFLTITYVKLLFLQKRPSLL